jgi:endonuclease/exonuclease/phosphatase family metal-dependent hydrolase
MNTFKLNLALFFITLTTLSYGALTTSEHNAKEAEEIQARFEECKNIEKYYLPQLSKSRRYSVECYKNYILFNGSVQEEKYNPQKYVRNNKIKISSFNVWNIGSSQTRFKDLEITAKMMNQWDLISAVEVLPILSDDASNNEKVIKLLSDYNEYKQKIADGQKLTTSQQKTFDYVKANKSKVEDLFRAPQYLKLLEALKSLDSSWALIVAPRESSRAGTAEMGAYFFRSKKVKLRRNAYCEYIRKGDDECYGYACMPRFHKYSYSRKAIMDKDYRNVFSKRPFMASFQSGKYDFTMINIHTAFRLPPKKEDRNEIIKLAYGSKYNVDNLPEGLNSSIRDGAFHRHAEVKVTMEFINKMLKKKFTFTDKVSGNKVKTKADKDIIFAGDFNLEGSDENWEKSLKLLTSGKLFVDEALTSVSASFYRKGKETNGLASNYDHFIFSDKYNKECNGEKAYVESYYGDSKVGKLIEEKYLVRDDKTDSSGKYQIIDQAKADSLMEDIRKEANSIYTISYNKIAKIPSKDIKKIISDFEERMIKSQEEDRSYYKVYMEAVSDHLPIVMECSTDKDLD